MQNIEIEKSTAHNLIESIGYVSNSVVSKTIIRKATGNVCVLTLDMGANIAEKTSPFDTLLQIIEGNAEVVIDKQSNKLKTGEIILIPAHRSHFVIAHERFKMISTIIKSGYEDGII